MSAWHTIDSAPKDGTAILLGHTCWETCWRGEWHEERLFNRRLEKAGWYRTNMQPVIFPTHWQPLPSPPEPPA